MSAIISVAYIAVLLAALFILFRWRDVRCTGSSPVGIFTLVALLFTAGLDMGLVMLPLTEFPTYAAEAPYQFTNPLALEFGMWGPLVWMMYFLTTFYFVVLEPKLRIFEIPLIKWVYNLTVIATCAFTCYLFSTALPSYVPGITSEMVWTLVVVVIAISVYSSSNMNFMKWLAIVSTWAFGILSFAALLLVSFVASGAGAGGLVTALGELLDYFRHLHRFVTPITEYHEFYLFWWFSWSIMIGQFVATFVGGLRTWQLAGAMIVLPTIPLAVWFSILYIYFQGKIEIPAWLNNSMVIVGVVFVINSLDSLIRLYSANLGFTVQKLGRAKYYVTHFVLQVGLVMAYQFTPFKIEWVGLVVISLYVAVFAVIIMRTSQLQGAITGAR